MEVLIWYILVILLFIQAYFLFWVFIPLTKDRIRPGRKSLPVSVIICAKNDLHSLQENLEYVLNQNYPDFEVIVMDDHSTDDTAKYLQSLMKSKDNLKYMKASEDIKDKVGKKWALAEAIKKSSHNYVLLTDADCRPNSLKWIEHMMTYFTGKTSLVLGIGRYQNIKKWYSSLIQFETMFTAFSYLGYALMGKPYMGVGRNLAYKKSVFKDEAMLNEKTASGDDDLFVQAVSNFENTDICTIPTAHTVSTPPLTYSEWLTQKKRHYSTAFEYKSLNKIRLTILKASFYLPNLLIFCLLFLGFYSNIILFIFLLRWLVEFVVMNRIARKLGFTQAIYLVPWFEIYFAFFDLWMMLVSKKSSRRDWK